MTGKRTCNTKLTVKIKDYLKLTIILLIVGYLSSGCANRSWLMEFSAHVRPYSGDIERLQHNAQYFKMIGKPELAIKELEGAHYRYPGDLKLINTLARTYDELGEFDRAQELYQEGLAQQSNNPAMINNLGFSYYLSGKFQEAENCFREVLGQNPNNQSAQNNLGLLLCRQNRQDEALQLWEEKDGQMAAQEKMKEVLALLGMPAPDIYAQKSSSHTSAPSKLEPGLSISKSEKIAARQLLNPAGQEPVRHGTAPKAAVAATPISPTEIMASKPGQSEMADQKLPQLPASTPELEKEIIPSADSKPLQSETEQKTAPVPVIKAEPEEQTNLAEVEPVAAAPVSPAEVMISEPDKLEMADQKLPQLPASTPELEKEIISSADSKPLQSEAEQKTAPVPVITAEPEEQTNLAEVEPVAAAPVSPAEVMISEPDKPDMADQKLSQPPASTPELEKEIIPSADSKPLQSEAEQKTAPVPVITAEPEEQTNLAEVEPVAAFRADGSEAADSSRLPILTAQELVDTKIDIRNGNGVSRMALDTRFSLCLEGFNVISSDNHIDFGVQETVLYYSPGKERVVQILNSKFFQASKAEQCLDLPEGVDIKIILGHDLADQESFLAKLDWESRLLTILNFDSQKQIAPSPAKSIELAAKSETNDQAIPHLEKQLIPSEQSLRLPLLSSQELIETAIDLRNGNGIKNMARNTRTRLSLEGFNVVSIANHIDFGADKTLIYYRPGKDRVVEFLTSKFFPVARAEESLNLPRWADIKIILGHDLSPQDRFLAQLAK